MMTYYELVTWTEHVNYAIGMILSSLLFYCIVFCNKSNLGKYRYLQMIIVFVDIACTSIQSFVRERFVSSGQMFALISIGMVNEEWALHLYVCLYALIFVLDDYSFLYRLWAVKYPHKIQKFSTVSFVSFLVTLATSECVTWYWIVSHCFAPSQYAREVVRDEVAAHFGVDTRVRAMFMAEYVLEDGTVNRRALLGISTALSIVGCCITFMVYAIRTIYVFLKEVNLKSQASLRLQKQLFITLCLQTLIPFFALYLSCGAFMILPLLNMDARWVSDLAPLVISFFLPLDSLAVLVTMTEYRREIIRILRLNKAPRSTIVSQMTTRTV